MDLIYKWRAALYPLSSARDSEGECGRVSFRRGTCTRSLSMIFSRCGRGSHGDRSPNNRSPREKWKAFSDRFPAIRGDPSASESTLLVPFGRRKAVILNGWPRQVCTPKEHSLCPQDTAQSKMGQNTPNRNCRAGRGYTGTTKVPGCSVACRCSLFHRDSVGLAKDA